ncbi:hypothetical protein HF086_006861 [Spodoptera exigua]|uniref:CCHC-type domain-containing protein n=1 Tax=Spodoptera exigua TaxID=7107 RepID=A0A922SDE0_SPOEX|nr:hypothetical protein HF086_006861 [Spodoptera exigua]
MGKVKKRKKDPSDGAAAADTQSDSSSEASEFEDPTRKYQIFKVPGYSRRYPETCKKTEYIVFLTHIDEKQQFSDKDRLAISNAIIKHCVTGVLHLRPINKFKIAITFDLSNNANVFLKNKKLLDELKLKATIPASDTEVTGVLTSVPIGLSNERIFSLIGSSRNIIQVRRFMRRVRTEQGIASFQPTQTVAVTFASTELPEYVYLDNWRHEVSVYVPPVKQCLHCLRFGHIAKFCRNTEVCSIELFKETNFPQLHAKTLETQIQNLTKSDTFMNILTQAITKITLQQKDKPINSISIKEILHQTFRNNHTPSK